MHEVGFRTRNSGKLIRPWKLLIIPAFFLMTFCFFPAQNQFPIPARRPFIPLTTMIHTAADARRINNLPVQQLADTLTALTSWYRHFHGETSNTFPFGDASQGNSATTLGEKLTNLGVMVTNYRNGSYVSQSNIGEILDGEARDLERNAPLAIGTWWPGHKDLGIGSDDDPSARLAASIDRQEELIVITSPARYKPERGPGTWPYVPSRGTGKGPGQKYSANTHDFISWLRIDDEIMRIRELRQEGNTLVVTVDRGYFRTKITSHYRNARVLSPVYIGSVRAVHTDTGLAGSPYVNKPQKALRYGIKFWQDVEDGPDRDGVGWIAKRIIATFGNGRAAPYFQGYTGVWLDITSSAPYNNADVYGAHIRAWDDCAGSVITNEKWMEYQIHKVQNLKRLIGPETGYPELHWTVNNLVADGNPNNARNQLIASELLDICSLEFWLQRVQSWEPQMGQNFLVQRNNWPALYWAKWSQLSKDFSLEQYKRFTYGSLLLVWRPSATQFEYGGAFGLRKPDELYFWDWGQPMSFPENLHDLDSIECEVPGDSGMVTIYSREYENGRIFVNPSTIPAGYQLSRTYYDVSRSLNGSEPPKVNQVQINGRDAVFLMLSR